MNKLPCELIEKILSYLNLEDRYSLRVVCKGWMFLIDNSNKKSKNLLISEPENSSCKFIFYHTGVNRLFIDDYLPFKENHLFLDFDQIDKLFLKSSNLILNNIERLVFDLTYIYCGDSVYTYDKMLVNFFKILPSFTRLDKLHIEKDIDSFKPFEKENRYFKLKLDTVKIFSFVGFKFTQLFLEAPKLIKLKLNLDLACGIKFDNPYYLELWETDHRYFPHEKTYFTNLLNFYCKDCFNHFYDEFFQFMRSIRVFNFFHMPLSQFSMQGNSDYIEESKKSIFYMQSYKIKDLKNYCDDKDFRLIYKHDPNLFETCDRQPFQTDFIYNKLEYDSLKLNRNNLMKLVHLKSLWVKESIEDENKLGRFIKEYNPHFIEFYFHNCQLSQDFYNKLPRCADFVNHLELFDKFTFRCLSDFNFDFILNLKYLLTLKTDQELSGEFIVTLYKRLKYFKYLYFVNNKSSCYFGPIYYPINETDKCPFKFEFLKYDKNDEVENEFEFSELEEFRDFINLRSGNLMSLPYSTLIKIFYHFNLEERIEYKRVSKKWKFIIEDMKESDLIIGDKETYTHQGIKRWFIDDYKFYNETQLFLPINELDKLLHDSYFNILKHVVRLNICMKLLVTKKLANKLFDRLLEKFEQLEKLNITNTFENYQKPIEITHKKLKILQIDGLKFDEIHLDTPKLEKVCLDFDVDKLRIIHLETIDFIYLKRYHPILEQLTRVRKIYCKELLMKFSDKILSRRKTLESIHIYHGNEDVFIDLIKQRIKLKRESIKIFYSNCLIKSVSDYVDYLDLKKDNSLANFYKLTRFKFDDQFFFEKTFKFKNLEFDTQILKKFQRLETIHVNGTSNEQILKKTIDDYGCFNNFFFKDTDLSQQFFNNLNTNAVLRLEIISNSVNLNFRFLLKLRFLESFRTNFKLEPDLIEELLTKLNCLSILDSNGYSLAKLQ